MAVEEGMGLLERAEVLARLREGRSGLLQRMLVYRSKLTACMKKENDKQQPVQRVSAQGRGGLLSRSLSLLNQEKKNEVDLAATPISLDYTQRIRSLSQRIEELPRDFTFFIKITDYLAHELNLERVAFFILSPYRQEFIPFTVYGLKGKGLEYLGYDQAKWQSVCGNSPNSIIRLEDEINFFGHTKLDLPHPIYFVPLVDENQLLGSLMLCALRQTPESLASLWECFTNTTWKIAQALREIMAPWKYLRPPARYFYSPAEVIKHFFDKNYQSQDLYYLLKISLSTLKQVLNQQDVRIVWETFLEFILFLFNMSLDYLGSAVLSNTEELLIVTRGADYFSPQLLLKYLTALSQTYFKGFWPEALSLALGKVVEYPACGIISQDFLAEI